MMVYPQLSVGKRAVLYVDQEIPWRLRLMQLPGRYQEFAQVYPEKN